MVKSMPHNTFTLHVLASGSKGNASIVESAQSGVGILIDCGITRKRFLEGCDEVGFDPANLQAILVTHEHSDHVKGFGVVSRALAKKGIYPKIYVSPASQMKAPIFNELADGFTCVPYNAQAILTFDDITVYPLATSHDAAASFGFRFESGGDSLGYVTDTGYLPPATLAALKQVRVLALESNHDKRMLEEGPYPRSIKDRIASQKGHLSNDQAAQALEMLLSDTLEEVIAMHVSEINNTYRHPKESLQAVLDAHQHKARVLVAYQNRAQSL